MSPRDEIMYRVDQASKPIRGGLIFFDHAVPVWVLRASILQCGAAANSWETARR
jgi:hypothetical protein